MYLEKTTDMGLKLKLLYKKYVTLKGRKKEKRNNRLITASL